jgi:transcriptional regulator with XRE-family HTH domain
MPTTGGAVVRSGRPKRGDVDRAFMREMGIRLRWVREALEFTQTEMAERVGVHQTSWSKWENGTRWPDMYEMPRLAHRLQITTNYLRNGSLQGVERELAIRLAALHPELVLSRTMDLGRGQS